MRSAPQSTRRMFLTSGFEVEFFVPDEQLVNYSNLFVLARADNFGMDGNKYVNLNVSEYRSNVHGDEVSLMAEYEAFRKTIAQFAPVFTPFRKNNSYGIHLSFDKVNKWRMFTLFVKIFVPKHPLVCLRRMLTIKWFKTHENRVEFRLIPTLEDDTLFRRFVEQIWKLPKWI